MNPLLFGKQFDLVDFEDVKLLMFKNDNLYQISVSAGRKNQSLREHSLQVARQGYPPSPVTPENVHKMDSARRGLYVYLNHLWENGIEFDILDVGSHVGDFSIRMGNFVRTHGKKSRVVSFDPTEAGALVDHNIQINGLETIVHHENLAISDTNGLIIFQVRQGHSDSASAFSDGNSANAGAVANLLAKVKKLLKSKHKFHDVMNYAFTKNAPVSELIARSVTLPDYFQGHHLDGNLFVKIDIEGLDSLVIETLWPRISSQFVSIITEFTPSSFPDHATATKFLEKLGEKFVIYDIFYSPNPTRFDRIDDAALINFPNYIQENRRYAYTDLLLIPKQTPKLDQLIKRLDGLAKTEDSYIL